MAPCFGTLWRCICNNFHVIFPMVIVSTISSHMILTTTHQSGYYCSHFRDEKTEVQRNWTDLSSQCLTAKWPSRNLNTKPLPPSHAPGHHLSPKMRPKAWSAKEIFLRYIDKIKWLFVENLSLNSGAQNFIPVTILPFLIYLDLPLYV